LSLAALAAASGTHFTTISKLERNQRAPSLRLAAALAEALGVTIDVLQAACFSWRLLTQVFMLSPCYAYTVFTYMWVRFTLPIIFA